MSEGTRRRNANAPSSATATARAPGTSSRSTTNKKRDDAVEELAPLPELWKFSTWPSSVKLFPLYTLIMIVGVLAYNTYQKEASIDYGLDLSSFERCTATFNFGFRINAANFQATKTSRTAAELGSAAEAHLELLNPGISVFGADPFPNGELPSQGWIKPINTLEWIHKKISQMSPSLYPSDTESLAAPASLGVFALMTSAFPGKGSFVGAAERQRRYLFDGDRNPRGPNGAVSYSLGTLEIRAETIAFVAPFLVYYAVATKDLEAARQSVAQIEAHRDLLRFSSGKQKGLWKHAHGDAKADTAAWSMGNAWAAHGIARSRATLAKWGPSNSTMGLEIAALDGYIAEILDAVIGHDHDASKLVRNYIGDSASFGETSGTALLAATAYRMAVLNPGQFATPKYLDWATTKRRVIAASVDDDGFAQPAVNQTAWWSKEPANPGSTLGTSLTVMLGSAWRDCVCSGICALDEGMIVMERPDQGEL